MRNLNMPETTLDTTLGTLTATDKIQNIGSITTIADKIIATNGIINDGSLTLTNGTLSTQISGNGDTNITGAVTNNFVKSPIMPVQKINNVSSKTVQSSNDTVFLGNRLNILTPQQIAQRANSNHAGSKSKSFCCKVSSPSIEKYSLR